MRLNVVLLTVSYAQHLGSLSQVLHGVEMSAVAFRLHGRLTEWWGARAPEQGRERLDTGQAATLRFWGGRAVGGGGGALPKRCGCAHPPQTSLHRQGSPPPLFLVLHLCLKHQRVTSPSTFPNVKIPSPPPLSPSNPHPHII